jgi:hypothetical protein
MFGLGGRCTYVLCIQFGSSIAPWELCALELCAYTYGRSRICDFSLHNRYSVHSCHLDNLYWDGSFLYLATTFREWKDI